MSNAPSKAAATALLKGMTSSAECAAAIKRLEADLKRKKKELAALEARSADELLDGTAASVEKLKSDIGAARAEIAMIEAALPVAEQRREKAARREHDEMIARRHGEAVRLRDEMIEKRKRAHVLARELVRLILDLREGDDELRRFNEFVGSEGRGELAVHVPWGEWRQKVLDHDNTRSASAGGKPRWNPEEAWRIELSRIEERDRKDGIRGFNLPGYHVGRPLGLVDTAEPGPHWMEIVFPELSPTGGDKGDTSKPEISRAA